MLNTLTKIVLQSWDLVVFGLSFNRFSTETDYSQFKTHDYP